MSVAAGDLVNASLQGAKIKLVGSSMSQLVFQLWAAKEITGVAQLKGKISPARRRVRYLKSPPAKRSSGKGSPFGIDYQLIYVQSVPAILDRNYQRSSGSRRDVGADTLQSERSRP